MRTGNGGRRHYNYIRIYLTGVLLYLIAVLPFLIYHGGIFFYYGDYNVQQVPFYVLANRAVHQGYFFWNPKVDLGSSMGGSFAFYLWGSPFFWLSTLLPEKWVPYALPFLMSLKYGTALTCAYAYIRTYTKTERAALLGALLYAFSGCQAVNIVFQHMHDATAFFPLYLLALDRSVARLQENSGRGAAKFLPSFVLMTAFSSIVNYYFFYGQVIFLILYYILRYVIGARASLRSVLRQVLLLILNALLGLAMAAFFLVQVLDVLTGNTRLNDVLSGYDMIVYSEPTTPAAILKSMFMIPDIIGRGTLFTNDQVRNSSLSCYLPGFALAGVLGWFFSHRGEKSWLKNLVRVFLVIAFIPIFNAVFSAFNEEYYARWFYMPVLFLSIITVLELEASDRKGLEKGFAISAAAWLILSLLALLPSRDDDGNIVSFSLLQYPNLFGMEVLATGIALFGAFLIIVLPTGLAREKVPAANSRSSAHLTIPQTLRLAFGLHRPPLPAQPTGLVTRRALVLTMIMCLVSTMGVMFNGTSLIARTGGVKWQQQMLDNVPHLPGNDPDDPQWFRVEADGTSTNYEMVWGYPTIHCFESTVTPSIVEFYQGIGVSRTVDSKMNFSHVGARYLLSERYYLENAIIHQDETYDDKGGLPGYTMSPEESDGYRIYQNDHYIPMGFTFDSYMTASDYAQISEDRTKDRILLRDLILDEDAAAQYGHLLRHDTDLQQPSPTSSEFLQDADERAATSCTAFSWSRSGFTATTADLPRENLLFLSVPYDKGFTAYVDGVKTDIIRADWGLMAVDVPAGVHEITFTYLPWGFGPACVLSLFSLLLFLALAIRQRRVHRRK